MADRCASWPVPAAVGDGLRIIDKDETAVVNYIYDPWGVPTVSGDTDLAALNPCSYRGYYYDQETGYYYLQSRYYDPEIGRFFSADHTAISKLTIGKLSATNSFRYCDGNPVNRSDLYWYYYISKAVFGLNPVGCVILAIGVSAVCRWIIAKAALLGAKLGAIGGGRLYGIEICVYCGTDTINFALYILAYLSYVPALLSTRGVSPK